MCVLAFFWGGGHGVLLHCFSSDVLQYHCDGRLNYRNHGLVYDILRWLDPYQSLKMIVNSALYIFRWYLRMLKMSDGRPPGLDKPKAQIFCSLTFVIIKTLNSGWTLPGQKERKNVLLPPCCSKIPSRSLKQWTESKWHNCLI